MARMNPAEDDFFVMTRFLGLRRHYRRGNPQELPAEQPPIVPPPIVPYDLVGVFEDSDNALVLVFNSDDGTDDIGVPVGTLMMPDPADPDVLLFPNVPPYVP